MIVFQETTKGTYRRRKGEQLLILDLAPPPLVKNQVYAPDCNFNIFTPSYPKLIYFPLGGEKIKRGNCVLHTLSLQCRHSVVLSSKESTPHVLCYKCCLARLQWGVAGKYRFSQKVYALNILPPLFGQRGSYLLEFSCTQQYRLQCTQYNSNPTVHNINFYSV